MFNYKKYGASDEHTTFKRFTNVSDNLDRKEFLKMFEGGKLVAKVPLSWKKSFITGVIIPQKIKNCNKCTKDSLCDGCDKLVNQKKKNFPQILTIWNENLLISLDISYLSI